MLPTSLTSRSMLLITCPEGLSGFVRQECEDLRFEITGHNFTGVTVTGSLQDAMMLNLCLATGHRVMYLIGEFGARTADELYQHIVELPWESVIPDDGYLSVTSTVLIDTIRDTRIANLKCKDAIVDRLTKTCGRRCDSGPERTGAVVHLYWKQDRCRLFIDTTGEPLSRRGYRKNPMQAPLQETLAAAIVRASRYAGDVPFVNPMCGSGTIAIEAALRALARAPGLTRTNFAFMHLRIFDRQILDDLRKLVRSRQRETVAGPIIATDIDPAAVDAARANAQTAGVDKFIEFDVCDYTKTRLPADAGGIVVMNPNYGLRLGEETELRTLYRGIGGFLKHQCAGYRGYVITANPDLTRDIGLKATRRLPLRNGDLECRLYEYELYAGRGKQGKEGARHSRTMTDETRALASEKSAPELEHPGIGA